MMLTNFVLRSWLRLTVGLTSCSVHGVGRDTHAYSHVHMKVQEADAYGTFIILMEQTNTNTFETHVQDAKEQSSMITFL